MHTSAGLARSIGRKGGRVSRVSGLTQAEGKEIAAYREEVNLTGSRLERQILGGMSDQQVWHHMHGMHVQ